MISQVLHTVWCYISGDAAGEFEVDHSLLQQNVEQRNTTAASTCGNWWGLWTQSAQPEQHDPPLLCRPRSSLGSFPVTLILLPSIRQLVCRLGSLIGRGFSQEARRQPREDYEKPDSPVCAHNEWDPLEEVIVGRVEGAMLMLFVFLIVTAQLLCASLLEYEKLVAPRSFILASGPVTSVLTISNCSKGD